MVTKKELFRKIKDKEFMDIKKAKWMEEHEKKIKIKKEGQRDQSNAQNHGATT